MSKDLKKHEARLEREARLRAAHIRRAVQEYNETVEKSAYINSLHRLKKQRKIERVVAEYAELHKSLKRVRKKLGAKKQAGAS